jgi:hypothetical protein
MPTAVQTAVKLFLNLPLGEAAAAISTIETSGLAVLRYTLIYSSWTYTEQGSE